MTRKPLALVPARGGSKRVPRKNIALLGAEPLLAWTVAAARDSGVFDAVWVSSEDADIRAAAADAGARVIDRPSALAGDRVRTVEVARHALEVLAGEGYTDLYVLLPSVPFRRAETVRRAWETYLEDPGDSLLSVVPMSYPPQWALRIVDERVAFMTPERPLRQDLEPAYKHDGGHSIVEVPAFLERGDVFGPTTRAFLVDREEALDIDHPEDLEYARFLCERRREEAK